jgi:hypothetical protein
MLPNSRLSPLLAFLLGVLWWPAAAHAQSARPRATVASNPASLAGIVHDENGAAAPAMVTIATHSLQQQASTLPDGTFRFSNLRPGLYVVCAQAAQAGFVDACLWQDRSALKIPLLPGQAQAAIVVPVQHGYTLKIHVNDPHGLLAAPASAIDGKALSVLVIGPSKLAQRAPIVAKTATGRDHAIVIPYNTPHTVVVHSATFVLKDASGKSIDDSTPVSVTASQGGPSQDLSITIDSPKP